MVQLTRLNHVPIFLNSDLIEHIDLTPDTVVTLTTGQILRVLETPAEVVERIIAFRRLIHSPAARIALQDADGGSAMVAAVQSGG